VTFSAWADEWLAGHRGRSTTRAVYGITLDYARDTFGRKQVRKLKGADVRAFLARIERENERRGRHVTETTLAKHLRQLSSCLEAARTEGLLAENPCGRLHKSSRPKVSKGRPSYFTDDELARLWPELASRPVYLTAAKLAVVTGCRFGELAGLRWPDVRLLDGELHVSHQWTAGAEVDTTKGGKARIVDLVPDARAILEAWYAKTGDGGLVLENETGGHLDDSKARKVLYAAMARAGVPRVGERGGKPRNWHSFRHTFARVALEHGSELAWVQAQLGHSSITLTVDTYGHWSRQAEKVAAARLDGAFTV
jgi:integrase